MISRDGSMVSHRKAREHDWLPQQVALPLPTDPTSPVDGGPDLPGVTVDPSVQRLKSNSAKSHRAERQKQKSISMKKNYVGVRVKLPVRDMLRNIRKAKGLEPEGRKSNLSQGEKKRVNTKDKRKFIIKRDTRSLEELSLIVEVLEEDLKTCSPHRGTEETCWSTWCGPEAVQHEVLDTFLQQKEMLMSSKFSMSSHNSSVSLYNFTEHHAFPPQDTCDDPCESSCQYQETLIMNLRPESWRTPSPHCPAWSPQPDEYTKEHKEEKLLISDLSLYAVDENERMPVYEAVAAKGRRARAFMIAKRMADRGTLDVKDSDGKTPLHLAAQRNQHFLVSDLLSLGADVNAKDRTGKTCLHLSAENGFIQVLEVLKCFIKKGMRVNLEEYDLRGRSAFQCAVVALGRAVQELDSLRSEQMKDTLECLLQMESLSHSVLRTGPAGRESESEIC